MKNVRSVIILLFLLLGATAFGQEKISSDEYFLEGVRHYNEQEWETAKTLLIKATQENPENDAAFYYLALSYYQLKDVQGCEAYLQKAQEMDPSNFWYRIRLAQFYADTQNMEKAIALYEEIAKDYPSKSSIYYNIIDLYTNNMQIDKALETLDKIETIKGMNEATGNARYELMLRQQRYKEAYEFLEEYHKKFPSPRSAFILGDLYKSQFQDTLALDYYQEALALDPTYTPANYGVAEIYRMRHNIPGYFENINIFMSDPNILLQVKSEYMKEVLITPYYVRQYLNEVDTIATNIINSHPKDSSAMYLIGTYYIQTGRDSVGANLFKEVLELFPADYKANIEYISLLYYMKDWDALIQQMPKTTAQFPEDNSLSDILPMAYWQSGDIDRAIKGYNALIKELPKGDERLYSYYSILGDLYYEKENTSKAFSYYNKSLKLKPDYNPVLNNYAYYLCLEGKKLSKAAQMSKKTILSEPDNPTYLDTYAWILYNMGEYQEAKLHLKHAMLYGGKDEPTLLDHYADILFALGEYDLAFIYWERAEEKDPTLGISEKIKQKKGELKKQ